MLDRVGVDRSRIRNSSAWYWQLPAVAAVRDQPLELQRTAVFLGENGTGKSTLLEAIAFAWRRRLTQAVHHWGPLPSAEDTDLHYCLDLDGERPPPQGGCFLRAEAMHAHFSAIDAAGIELRAFDGRELNSRSHGEGFLAFLESRRFERGLYLLDEPEAALSFRSCLTLIALLADAVAAGSQVIMATHSPVLAAFPGAQLWELSAEGITEVEFDSLALIRDWRDFLAAPQQWTKHLVD
jgi:predicted ATPase